MSVACSTIVGFAGSTAVVAGALTAVAAGIEGLSPQAFNGLDPVAVLGFVAVFAISVAGGVTYFALTRNANALSDIAKSLGALEQQGENDAIIRTANGEKLDRIERSTAKSNTLLERGA